MTYHIDPKGGRPATYAEREHIGRFKSLATDFGLELDDIPDCREKSLAITKIEEAAMWATRAAIMTSADP